MSDSIRVVVTMSSTLQNRCRATAEKAGLSLAEWVRFACVDALARHEGNGKYIRANGPPLREYETEEERLEAMDREVLREHQLPVR